MGVPIHKQTLAEYLAWEDEQPERHAFHNGEIFPMVGARRGHGSIIQNPSGRLDNHLDSTPCRVFAEGKKVQIADDTVVYLDVFVTCGQKFALYRRLPSLREYALIDPDTRRAEVMRLGGDGRWDFIDLNEQAEVEFASVGFRLALVEPFKRMNGTQPPDH